MTDAPSFQDFLSDAASDPFVGRGEQLVRFEKALDTDRPPFLILAISGPAGVGKTSLLEQLALIADDHAVLAARADATQTNIPTLLMHFAGQFAEAGHPFNNFDASYERYTELKQQVETDPDAPQDLLNFALQSTTRITKRSLRRSTASGSQAETQVRAELEDLLTDQDSAMATYVREAFVDIDDQALLLDTEAELTRTFLRDLNGHAQQRRTILFFDQYDQAMVNLENWLISALSGQYGQFSSRVFFVIAGEAALSGAWSPFRRATRLVKLREFTESEARDYLTQVGVNDEGQISTLLQLSEAMPVWLAFLTAASPITTVAETAVASLLGSLTPVQRQSLLAASLPCCFEQETFQLLLPEQADSAFEWLSQSRFVAPSNDGFAFHPVIRAALLRQLRAEDPTSYAAQHEALAHHFADKCAALDLPARQRHLNPQWAHFEQQRHYHHLSANPSQNLAALFTTLLTDLWNDIALPQEERKRAVLRNAHQILQQVATETDEPTVQQWAERLIGLLMLSPDDRQAEIEAFGQFFADLGGLAVLDTQTRSLAHLLSGAVYADSNPQQTLEHLAQAVELQPDDPSIYYWRGHIHLEAERYGAAIDNFGKMIELRPDYADSYYWRGRAHLEAGHYAPALADFSQAVGFNPKDSLSYQGRGITHFERDSLEMALTDLDQAITLAPNNGDNYYWRGRVQRALGRHEEALADFGEAINLQPGNDDNYYWRGNTHLANREYHEALADLSEAIDLEPRNPLAHQQRGWAHLQIEDYRSAQADFSEAIALHPQNGDNYRGRALATIGLNDTTSALADLDQAIAYEPDDVASYESRAQLYLAQDNPEAALADLDQVLSRQPDSVLELYDQRARLHERLGHHQAAITDLSRLIAQQSDEPNHYVRRSPGPLSAR